MSFNEPAGRANPDISAADSFFEMPCGNQPFLGNGSMHDIEYVFEHQKYEEESIEAVKIYPSNIKPWLRKPILKLENYPFDSHFAWTHAIV